jgi:prepilin-type N-terminal cleavage/methylation domain-containing protein
MPTSSVGNRAQAGVTLIEMVVVVSIVGLVLAVLAPSMTAGLDSVRMASAADDVASFLNAAVNRAERRQQAIEVLISVKDNKLALYSNDPRGDRELKLPDGISIETVLPHDESAAETGVQRLVLLPGATIPGVGIQLVNGHKSRRIVRLDPMTGFPRIEAPKADQ